MLINFEIEFIVIDWCRRFDVWYVFRIYVIEIICDFGMFLVFDISDVISNEIRI